jgi:hypothetical protein
MWWCVSLLLLLLLSKQRLVCSGDQEEGDAVVTTALALEQCRLDLVAADTNRRLSPEGLIDWPDTWLCERLRQVFLRPRHHGTTNANCAISLVPKI